MQYYFGSTDKELARSKEQVSIYLNEVLNWMGN